MTKKQQKQYDRMIARRKAKRAARRAALDAYVATLPPPYKYVEPVLVSPKNPNVVMWPFSEN